MPAYLLLLRGINVGKANRLPMATLQTVLEQLGCTHVRTLLNSGNAIFQWQAASAGPALVDSLAEQIGAALLAQTGLDLHCIVKSAGQCVHIDAQLQLQLDSLARAGQTPDPSHFLIGVSRSSDTLQAFAQAAPGDSALQCSPESLLLNCPGGISQSATAALLVSKKWRLITCRNLATWQKIMALLGS